MTAKKRFIIPSILFVISSACGFIQTSNHTRAVENLLNNAGRNGEPVIAALADAYQNLPYNFNQVELRLYNIEGDYVRLAPAQTFNSDSYFNLLYFTTDGMLYMYIEYEPFLPDGLNGLILTAKRFDFYRPRQHWDFPRDDATLVWVYVDKSPDEVGIFKDYFVIHNTLEGSYEQIEFEEPDPLLDGEYLSDDFYQLYLSNDHSKLIMVYDPGHNGGEDVGIWIYDVGVGTWNFLPVPYFVPFKISSSLDGKSFAVMRHDSAQDYFSTIIDLESGNIIFTQTCSMPDIWQNWVVMKDYARLDPKLKIYDIRNDWHEYEFDKPELDILPGFIFQTFAIFEPPPDGIDGLYCSPE
ncbi:MAG: hypothetical protein NTY09_14095 [bacterium]|nr:hypothetical protein [bacterium]